MQINRKESRRPPRHRVAAMALLICVTTGGCASLVRDVTMIPIRAAETVAVETAKVPFDAAQSGADALVDAVFKSR